MAQAVAKAVNEHVAKSMQVRATRLQQESETQLNALKSEWAGKFDENSEFGRKALAAAGKAAGFDEKDLAAVESAIGTSKMLKFMFAVGAGLKEADLGGGGGGGGGGPNMTPEQAATKLQELREKRTKNEISADDYLKQADVLAPIIARAGA